MSKNTITRYTNLLFVLVVCAALVGADLVVLAQNDNEMTRGGTMTSQNGNGNGNASGGASTGTTRRRGRRRSGTTMSGTVSANTSGGDATMTGTVTTQGNTSMSAGATTGGSRRRRRRRRAATTTDMSGGMATGTTTMANANSSNMGGEQTDLSGTYTGTATYPEGGLSGNGTLTITGNNFTITPEGGGASISGRVTAVTTRGYTGVTMMFGDPTAPPPTQNPPPPPLPTVSLQWRRVGNTVTLKTVPGEKREFNFTAMGTAAGGGGMRTRGRRRRARRTRTANTGTTMTHE